MKMTTLAKHMNTIKTRYMERQAEKYRGLLRSQEETEAELAEFRNNGKHYKAGETTYKLTMEIRRELDYMEGRFGFTPKMMRNETLVSVKESSRERKDVAVRVLAES